MKIGLMLGGGGAKGAYQLGVLKALEEQKLMNQIECIAGASIGALNGFYYLASQDINQVIYAWRYGIKHNPIQFKKKARIKEENQTGLFSLQVLREMGALYFDEEIFKTTKTDIFVSTTKVVNPKLSGVVMRWKWENEIIHLNNSPVPFEDAISSSSVPIIFGTNNVHESYYIDGGLTNNNPIDVLIKEGCDLIFSSSLDPKYNYKQYKDHKVIIVNLTSREALPKTTIKSYAAVLNFNQDLFEHRINYGYYTTQEMIKECISKGILKLEDNKVIPCDKVEEFQLIDVPVYINGNIKVMRHKHETNLRQKEK